MVFRRRKVGGDFSELNVKFDVLLTRVNSTKLLGVYIDEYLSWKSHVSYISSKIASVLGIIYSVNKLLLQKILMNLYNTLILSHFSYAVLAWGGCLITLTNRSQVLQKKAVRAITNSPYLAHTAPLYKHLNILNVKSLYYMRLAQFMFLFMTNQLPCNFTEMFIVNADIHSYETRSSNKFHLPSVKTTFLQRNIYFSGPSLWNLLPNDIVSCSSLILSSQS